LFEFTVVRFLLLYVEPFDLVVIRRSLCRLVQDKRPPALSL